MQNSLHALQSAFSLLHSFRWLNQLEALWQLGSRRLSGRWHLFCEAPPMAKELETAYFRKLRMIYCSELQMIGFLADLAEQTADFKFGSSMQGVLRLCGERIEALEKIAVDREFWPEGDDGEVMERLVTEGRHELRHCARGRSRDVVIADICISLHRFLVVNYRLARNLANRLEWADDASRLEELMDLLEERFPQTCDHSVRRSAFAPAALAV